MIEFHYEAATRTGELQSGVLKADSRGEAVAQLSGRDLTIIDLREAAAPATPWLQAPLSRQDLMLALHELATLVESDVPLAEGVTALAAGAHHPELKAGFERAAQALMRGESLHAALETSGFGLPSYVPLLVRAGESSGQLGGSLRRAVEQMNYDHQVQADFRAAITYPSVLVVSGVAAVVLVFIFVVPKFANLLDSGNELPWLARVVLQSGVFFNENLGMLTLVTVGAVAVVVQAFRQPAVRQSLLEGLARLPLIGDWLAESDTATWASVMASMLATRVDIVQSLELAASSVRIRRREDAMEVVAVDVKGGVALSDALEKQNALTPTGYNLIRVGEQSGRLPEMLSSLSKLYEDSSRNRMRQALTLIEPLCILVIGGAIGVIITGVILAITSVNDVVM